jgi:hypothetical protein
VTEYGDFQMGQESGELEQLHQEAGSAQEYDSQFGIYAQDHASAESTDFSAGKQVEYEDANSGVRYESTDFVSYSHDETETESVFAAEGSEHAASSEYLSLDALQAQFERNFAEGTQITSGDAGPAIAGK